MLDRFPPAWRRFFVMGVFVAFGVGLCPAASVYMPAAGQVGSPSGSGADSPGNRLLLDEDFNGGELDTSVWNTCHWWNDGGCTIASNNELEWYVPGQVAVSGNALHLTAARRQVAGPDGKKFAFASGMVTTGPPAHDEPPKLAFRYGTVEASINLPEGRGLWPAIWLLPATEQSRPEIDMLEMRGSAPRELSMHLHPKKRSADSLGKTIHLPERSKLTAGWHTIGLNWTPGRLVFSLDGEQTWSIIGDQVPNEPMYLVMNLAVGGIYPGSPDQATKFPADFTIGHVRIRSHD